VEAGRGVERFKESAGLSYRNAPPNAAHHPRPYSGFMRGTLKGRRVHAG
jgi:hypothetical protein